MNKYLAEVYCNFENYTFICFTGIIEAENDKRALYKASYLLYGSYFKPFNRNLTFKVEDLNMSIEPIEKAMDRTRTFLKECEQTSDRIEA